MDKKQMELLQGTLDMLILKAVSLGPLHGYGILLRIQQISKDRLEIQQGSLYPALYRLEHQGWITSEWGQSENKRKAKYYRLTAAGKRKLQTEAEKWNRMAELIEGLLGTTAEEVSRCGAAFAPGCALCSSDRGWKARWTWSCASTLRRLQRIWCAMTCREKKRCGAHALNLGASSGPKRNAAKREV